MRAVRRARRRRGYFSLRRRSRSRRRRTSLTLCSRAAARTFISKSGQRWYFWSQEARGVLAVTQGVAGGALAGRGAPGASTRQHVFYIEIFRISSTPITASPTGGAYNLTTDVITPPAGWSISVPSRTLGSGEAVWTCRARIDPNVPDTVVTPLWLVVHLLGEAGTITAVTTQLPLTGGGTSGAVDLAVGDKSITAAKMADESVELRALADGTAGSLIGYGPSGAAAEIVPAAKISDLDVPDYSSGQDGKILGFQGNVPVIRDERTIPRQLLVSVSGSQPTGGGDGDLWFADRDFSGASGVVERDGTTPRPAGKRGDAYVRTGAVWVFRGSVNSMYAVATAMLDGLMSAADKTKLAGIAAGAQVNPGEATTRAPGLMSAADKAKLDGVAAGAHVNVQPDWAETDSTAQDFIVNKPTRISDFDVPDYAGNALRFLGLNSSLALAWMETGHHIVQFGTGFPSNPADNNVFIFVSSVTGLADYVDNTASALDSARRGDVARYDAADSRWEFEGSLDTVYSAATGAASGLMSAADKTKLDGVAAGAQVNPGAATGSDAGLMSAADKAKLDLIEARAQRNPGAATTTESGLMTPADRLKLGGIDTGAQVNPGAATDTADGLMSAADKAKLDGVAAGAEANVQVDFGDNDPSSLSHILNRPVIPAHSFTNSEPGGPKQGDILIAVSGNSSFAGIVDRSGNARPGGIAQGDVLVRGASDWVYQGAGFDRVCRRDDIRRGSHVGGGQDQAGRRRGGRGGESGPGFGVGGRLDDGRAAGQAGRH